MQSAGGFIIDDLNLVDSAERYAGPQPEDRSHPSDSRDVAAMPKPLSPKQEAKLRSFLDASLDIVNRGYRKRFDPSSPLRTLTLYLNEWTTILSVLGRIPPYGSGSTNLLISYLLRCSTDLCDGIAGYGLGMELQEHRKELQQRRAAQNAHRAKGLSGPSVEEETQSSKREKYGEHLGDGMGADQDEEDSELTMLRDRQLNYVLQTLDLFDRIWVAILRGDMVNFSVAQANAKAAFPDHLRSQVGSLAGYEGLVGSRSNGVHQHQSTMSFVPSPVVDARFSNRTSITSDSLNRESLPIHGGKGTRTVGVTDQVRLRNIAIASREKLFAWMRTELDAPAPPSMEDDETQAEPADNTVAGMFGEAHTKAGPNDADLEDPEMEDVEIEKPKAVEEGYDVEDDTAEHRHYQNLFDRNIDPDAEDEDDLDNSEPSSDGAGDTTQELGASVAGTISAVRAESVRSKRKRDQEDEQGAEFGEDVQDDDSMLARKTQKSGSDVVQPDMSRSEVGSLDLHLPNTIGQWDLAFTRIFSKTLRTLSDL